MKPYLLKIGVYLAAFFAGVMIQIIAPLIGNLLEAVFSVSNYNMFIVNCVLEILVVATVAFVFTFREGYDKRKISPIKTAVAVTVTPLAYQVVLHILPLGFILPFYAKDFLSAIVFDSNYFATGRYVAKLDLAGWVEPVTILAFYLLIFAPVMILGEVLGVRKRKKENEKMRHK